MRLLLAALALASGLFSGCASVFTHVSVGPHPYIGSIADIVVLADGAHGGHSAIARVLAGVDLPLSFVLDTALLPVCGIAHLVRLASDETDAGHADPWKGSGPAGEPTGSDGPPSLPSETIPAIAPSVGPPGAESPAPLFPEAPVPEKTSPLPRADPAEALAR